MSKRVKRVYTKEERDGAVRLVVVSGLSAGRVSKDLGIPEPTITQWVTKHRREAAGENGTGALSEAERAELKQLRREVATLRMERDILKKATAFFARESDRSSR